MGDPVCESNVDGGNPDTGKQESKNAGGELATVPDSPDAERDDDGGGEAFGREQLVGHQGVGAKVQRVPNKGKGKHGQTGGGVGEEVVHAKGSRSLLERKIEAG